MPQRSRNGTAQLLSVFRYIPTRARARAHSHSYSHSHSHSASQETNSRNIIGARFALCIASILNFYRKPKRLHRISAAIFSVGDILHLYTGHVEYYYASRSPRARIHHYPRAVKAFSCPALTQIINGYELVYPTRSPTDNVG